MEAPTPASALIHSSTLVVAGVFLIIRFSVIFEFTLFTNYYLVLLGALTLAFGSISANFQHDIKKLVAYSTISQIGYLVCGCGFLCYEEVLLYLNYTRLKQSFPLCYSWLYSPLSLVVILIFVKWVGHISTHLTLRSITFLESGFNLAGLPYSAGFLLVRSFYYSKFYGMILSPV